MEKDKTENHRGKYMNLLTMEHVSKAYTDRVLLDDVGFGINKNEKIGVIGVNGMGKSTLLKIVAGIEESDAGTISMGNQVKICYLPQTPVFEAGTTILRAATEGNYDELNRWTIEAEAKSMLNQLGFTDYDEKIEHMSGGQKKRVALVRALLTPADMLVLDEPTNHLDNEMSEWLEEYLIQFRGAILMVTHDRYFLDRVVNRIVEVDHGKLYNYPGNYSEFVRLKAERQNMELATERKRKSLLRTELEWLHRGARARSTKQKAHIDRIHAMQEMKDIQEEKQKIIEKLCKHVVERNHEDLKVWAVSDPVEAITGADYIVTTLRVGGDHSRVVDETIALDLGVIGQETTGVGGFSMAVRTIPVLIEYCELIKKYAPDAWIFNFTNPSGLVTQALRSAGYDKIIGICDAPSSTKFRMAHDLGVEEDDLYVEFFGLNHLSWIRSVKKKGEEILPELLADDAFLQGVQEFSMFDSELLRSIGFLPNEYLYYYYHREKALENIKKSGATRGKTIENVNIQMMDELKHMDIDADPEGALQIFLYYMQVRENSYMSIESGLAKRPLLEKGQLEVPDGMGYAGVMLDCIEGMQSEKGKYLVLSVENNGSIPGLADEDVIETTCLVSKDGIHPVKVKEVPEHCYLLIRLIKMYEKLTVEAVKNKSKETAVQALMLHPLVNSYSLAKQLVDKYDEVYGGIFR